MREQEIANISLFLMTIWNVLLGILMVFEVIPVFYGMCLATGGMIGIVIGAWKTLMADERPWESPARYKQRTQKDFMNE
jgi:uncharacterized membrane protein YfcA